MNNPKKDNTTNNIISIIRMSVATKTEAKKVIQIVAAIIKIIAQTYKSLLLKEPAILIF